MTMGGPRRPSLPSAQRSALEAGLTAVPSQAKPAGADARLPVRSAAEPFPTTRLRNPSHDEERDIRLHRLVELNAERGQLERLQRELQAQERCGGDVYNGVQHLLAVVERLETGIKKDFIPQHAQEQLISPRSFFTSRLFHVKSTKAKRAQSLAFALDAKAADGARYVGPELRQGDGFVFMALLNLCRDYRVGKQACFDVAAMCVALWGSYNGQQRKRLKECIRRLQRSTIEFSRFTVQLVQRFEHPESGEWSVSLDPDIVELFRGQQEIWLELPLWRRLSEGLTTWLYGYVRSQRKLIPTPIDNLRERCGSDADEKHFKEALGKSLKQLAGEGVIDSGWSLNGTQVHWRLPPREAASPRKKTGRPPAPEQVSLPYDDVAEQVLLAHRRRA
jgi:hypothetical protein